MKRNLLFAILGGFVFAVLFLLLWPVVSSFVADIPSLTFAAGGLCVVLSGGMTRYIICDLMSVPHKD